MKVTALNERHSIGAEISGLDLMAPLDTDTVARLKDALFRYHVLVFRDQNPDAGAQIAFARSLGAVEGPEPSASLTSHDPEHPEIQWLSYLRRDGSAPTDMRPSQADAWHTDYAYLPDPPELGFLAAVELPENGPDTLFLNMQYAYETLSEGTKSRLDGRTAVHSQIGGLDPKVYRLPPYLEPGQTKTDASAMRSATHPLVKTHRVSGKRSLYLAECYTVGVEGLDEDESRTCIAELYHHALATGATYRHVWRAGDCVLWDNSTLNHKRSHPLNAPRVLSRLTIRLQE